jgi:hypothetical protein
LLATAGKFQKKRTSIGRTCLKKKRRRHELYKESKGKLSHYVEKRNNGEVSKENRRSKRNKLK